MRRCSQRAGSRLSYVAPDRLRPPLSQQLQGQLGSVHSGSQSQHKIISMGVTSSRSQVGTNFRVAVAGSVGTAAPRPWRPFVRAVR
jgi:hypothetical protein